MSPLYLTLLLCFVLTRAIDRNETVSTNKQSLCEEQFEFECGADSEPKCIPKRLKCNNLKDCSNGADESGCVYSVECSSTSLLCANDRCLDLSYRCNGVDECTDGSDEVGCAFHQPIWCPSNRFHCKLGPCIDKSLRCDGHTDCPHADDEKDCPKLPDTGYCKLSEYRCESTNVCIPVSWVCDEMPDCTDSSDEKYCVGGKLLPDRNSYFSGTMPQCTKSQFACRGESNVHKCIDRIELCDGKSDCNDGSDEGGLCNQCSSFNCDQDCTENPLGPVCSCSKGTILMSDRRSCRDVDECVDRMSNCDHYCHNTQGSYRCSCAPNYILQSDGHQCRLEQPNIGQLLVSYGHEVRALPLNSEFEPDMAYSPLFESSVIKGDIRGMDFNSHDGHLYMAVPVDGGIFGRIYASATKQLCLLDNLSGLANLAVDWVTDNIYYTVGTPSVHEGIGVCRSDGRFCRHLISGEGMHRLDGLSVHPRRGLMFWAIWAPGDSSRIEMAHMDGEQRQVIVKEKLSMPSGLTIDYITDKLYFGDAQLGMIERIDIFTDKREVVINDGTHHPFDLLVFDQQLFWTDWDNEGLLSVPLRSVNESERTLLTSFIQLPFSVTINHPAYQDQNIENPCLNAGCSHICALKHIDPKSDKPTATCLCPSGYRGLHSMGTGQISNQTQCVPIEDENLDRATLPRLCFDSFMTLCGKGLACGKGSCLVEPESPKTHNQVRCSCPEGLIGHFCEVDASLPETYVVADSGPKLKDNKSGSGLSWIVSFLVICTILLILGLLIGIYIRKTGVHKKYSHRPLFPKFNIQLPPVMFLQKRVSPEQQLIVPKEQQTARVTNWEVDCNESFSNPLYCDEYESFSTVDEPLLTPVTKLHPYVPMYDNDSGISATSSSATP